jgi:hypothetical protein
MNLVNLRPAAVTAVFLKPSLTITVAQGELGARAVPLFRNGPRGTPRLR